MYLFTSQPEGRRGPPVTVGRLIHAGQYRQQPGQIGEGKEAEHQLLRGRQQQVTPCLPGLPPGRYDRRQAAAVNEGQFLQVHNDPRTRGAAADSTRTNEAAWVLSSSPHSATTT